MKWYQKIKARTVSPAGGRIKEGGQTPLLEGAGGWSQNTP